MNARALYRRFRRAPEVYGGRVLIAFRGVLTPEIVRLWQTSSVIKSASQNGDRCEVLIKVGGVRSGWPHTRSWSVHGSILKAIAHAARGRVRFNGSGTN